MSMQEDFQDPAKPKAGRSTGVKILLVLGVIGGVMGLICCGIGGFVYWKFKDAMSTDPVVVQAKTQEILKLQIPAGFKPMMSMSFMGVKMVMYQGDPPNESMLMLMEMPAGMGNADPEQQRDAMLNQMRQQSGGMGGGNANLQIDERETRNYTINGKKVPFIFAKGKGQGGKAMRQVTASVPTASSAAILMLMVPEEKYDESAVDAMISSMGGVRAPDDAPTVVPNEHKTEVEIEIENGSTKPETDVEIEVESGRKSPE